MSQYSRHLASFLARTYYPVTVSFTSTPLQYSNPLFSVSHRINESKYIDNNRENGYISFDTSLNKYHKSRNVNNNKLNTPESFIKYMLDKPKSHTTFELNKNSNDELKDSKLKDSKLKDSKLKDSKLKDSKLSNICEFNTDGIIPLRYIDMINDFTPHKFEYKTPSKLDIKLYETELFEKIADINNNIILDIYQYAQYLSEKDKLLKIVVTKAPQYPFDTDFLKKYNNNTFRKTESIEYIQKSLKKREWKSSDGDFSTPSTKIFFNRSRELKSLNYDGYRILFSSSGGIDFSYVRDLPWFELKQKMGNYQSYYDVSGRDTYYSTYTDNIGITEFVIFSEALAKEGAKFTFEYV